MTEAYSLPPLHTEDSEIVAEVIDITQVLGETAVDRASLEDAFVELRKLLLSSVSRRVDGNFDTAEDVVSDAFVRFLEHEEYSARDQDEQRRILFTIAKRKTLDLYRRTSRKSLIPFDDFENADSRPDTLASESMEKSAERVTVAKEFKNLPEILREVVFRYYWQTKTCDEIAAELKIPSGTVKSRLSRARAVLREVLEA